MKRKVTNCLWIALLGALLAACTDFAVFNNSAEYDAMVSINLPNRGRFVGNIKRSDYFSTVLSNGGAFNVAVLPNEAYREELKQVRESFRKVFTLPNLSAEQIAVLNKQMAVFNERIERISKGGASCGGVVPNNGAADVNINWDAQARNWTITCKTMKRSDPGTGPGDFDLFGDN
jgi:hypothetical protein